MRRRTFIDAIFQGIRNSFYGAVATVAFSAFLCGVWMNANGVSVRDVAEKLLAIVMFVWLVRNIVLLLIIWRSGS